MVKRPENAAGPVDFSWLVRQTGGDPALERDVVGLFLSKSLADLARLEAAATDKERREIAHSMVGSARAVGAERMARLAADVENGPAEATGALAALKSAVGEARQSLSDYLAARQANGE